MLLLGNVKDVVLINGRSGPLALELEHHNTIVVTSSEQVDFRMSSDDPDPIVLPLKGVDYGTLVKIPYANRLVLAGRKDEVLVGVEKTAASVLEMAAAGIDFPL